MAETITGAKLELGDVSYSSIRLCCIEHEVAEEDADGDCNSGSSLLGSFRSQFVFKSFGFCLDEKIRHDTHSFCSKST